MFEIISATIYDTGRYSCTVKNPAGEDTKDAYVQILSSACGGFVAVHENETVTIQSSDFPWPYQRAKSCSWRVCPPQGMKLEFNFTTFDLRTFDKLEIINECDRQQFPWRTYCGSKVSPGSFVSHCNSTCMQIVLNSGIPPNRVATGFQVNIRTKDRDETEDNLDEMMCGSNLVARVISSQSLFILEVNVKILEILRQDEPMVVSPDEEISIKHDFTIRDMYGCPMEFKPGSEYIIFASYEGNINNVDPISFVMDFAVDPNDETSANIVQRLKAIKEEPPQCEPLPAK